MIDSTCIETINLSVKSLRSTILDNINFTVKEGEFFSILGPNGSGKTSLVKTLSGETRSYTGDISFQHKNLRKYLFCQLAKRRAVLPQKSHINFPMKVRDIVLLGRQIYNGTEYQRHDNAVIDACLQQLDLRNHSNSYYDNLSGGEQHRTHIARIFAQICNQVCGQYCNHDIAKVASAPVSNNDLDVTLKSASKDFTKVFTKACGYSLKGKLLILDEPTNHLDIFHQYTLLETLKRFQERGLTIITVMHDLSLALQYSDRIMLLKKGQNQGCYTPKEIISDKVLNRTYDIDIKSYWNEEMERYFLAPNVDKYKLNIVV